MSFVSNVIKPIPLNGSSWFNVLFASILKISQSWSAVILADSGPIPLILYLFSASTISCLV